MKGEPKRDEHSTNRQLTNKEPQNAEVRRFAAGFIHATNVYGSA